VLPAFFLGTWQVFFSRKGAPPHRSLGVLYLSLMTMTAIAAFFIRASSVPSMPSFHGFTPIHIFVVVTLANVAITVLALRARKYRLHRATMMGLYVSGIGIAGALAFMPGRIMHAVVFGG
jgi:uncharacterized membrane protein